VTGKRGRPKGPKKQKDELDKLKRQKTDSNGIQPEQLKDNI